MLKWRRSTWRPSVQVRCEMIQYFALLSSVGQTICRWCVIYFSTRTKASPCVSSGTVSVRSLLFVEMGKAVTIANGFVTGQGIPAWTTQRLPISTGSPVSTLPRLLPGLPPQIMPGSFRLSAIHHLQKTGRFTWTPPFQVRSEMIRSVLTVFVCWSNEFRLIYSQVSSRYEGKRGILFVRSLSS